MKLFRHLFGVGLVILCGVGCSQLKSYQLEHFEITEVDLFGLTEWDATQVSILRMMLGMKRTEVLRIAAKEGLKVEETDMRFGTRKPCAGQVCFVLTKDEQPIGVDLWFNPKDQIQAIFVDPMWEAQARGHGSAALTNKFKGETHRLVNSYSDELRRKLLGPEDSTEDSWPTEYMIYRLHTYKKLGVNFHISYHGIRKNRKQELIPNLDGIEFVQPSSIQGPKQ
jgi:hypothetical protein